jgi:hypothetical protein
MGRQYLVGVGMVEQVFNTIKQKRKKKKEVYPYYTIV